MDLIFELDLDQIGEDQVDYLMDKTKRVTEIITREQLKTQSNVTSIYGCNLNNSLMETDQNELIADQILGKQIVLKNGGDINIRGDNIGGLVLANINKDPQTKRRGDKIVKRYKANDLGNVKMTVDSKITNLVITNSKNITLNIKSKVRVSIELINSNDITLIHSGFNFFRCVNCDSIDISGDFSGSTIFDIRKSWRIHLDGIDMRFNPNCETRYEYYNGRLTRVKDEDDIFYQFNSPKSVPDITLAKLYRT